jgi:AcrR family transcriptional regulator
MRVKFYFCERRKQWAFIARIFNPNNGPGGRFVDSRTFVVILLSKETGDLKQIFMSKAKQTSVVKRGRGRPRAFDRHTAIQQAMKLFWDRGYEGTTFDDLIGAMRISPSSFYHEFGSKELLYREAVDYYVKAYLSFFPRILSTHRDTRVAFEALIEEAAAFLANDASPAGCMISLAGTQISPHLRSVADFAKGVRKAWNEALVNRLKQGVSDGALPPETNIKELAAYFGAVFRGMAAQARDGASRKQLLAIGRVAMRAWPTTSNNSQEQRVHSQSQ